MLLYKGSQGKHRNAMYTNLQTEVAIQNPDILTPGVVEMRFESIDTHTVSLGEMTWEEPHVYYQTIEVDVNSDIPEQLEWVSKYLAESLNAVYKGYVAITFDDGDEF